MKDKSDFEDLFKTAVKNLIESELLRPSIMSGLNYFLTEKGCQIINSKLLIQ